MVCDWASKQLQNDFEFSLDAYIAIPLNGKESERMMSPSTLRIIIGLVLFIHGIGHSMAFFPALGLFSSTSWHHRSWLLTGVLGDTASRILSIILFGAALIGFIGATLGLFGWLVPHNMWRTLAVISSAISLVSITLFWNSFASFFPNKVGAIAVDVAILVSLLWLNWPSEVEIGL